MTDLTVYVPPSALTLGYIADTAKFRHVVAKASLISEIPSGDGTISGILDIDGVVGARVVRLYVKKTGIYVGKTISDKDTGEYLFSGLSKKVAFYTTGHDHNNVYESDIADNLFAT